MPGLPSQTQQPQPQDNHDPNLLDMLQHIIVSKLSGPTPQPPLAPPPQPVSNLGALAAARNPQFAGAIMQRAQQPAEAQYQQAQQAFQAAMAGRSGALQAGSQIAGRQLETQALLARLGKPALRERVDYSPGSPTYGHLFREAVDPWNAQTSSSFDAGVAGEGKQWILGPDGRYTAAPTKGPAGKATGGGAGGDRTEGTIEGKLNDGAISDIRSVLDTETTAKEMVGAYNKGIQKYGPGLVGQVGQYAASKGAEYAPTLTGKIDPDAARFERNKEKLKLQLNRPVSGQSRLLQSEIGVLGNYLGEYTTDPKVTDDHKQLLDTIQQMKDVLQKAYPREWAIATQGTLGSRGGYSGRTLSKTTFSQLSPQDQKRFTSGGGQVGP